MLAIAQGNTFYETAAILSLAAVLGAIGQKLRQPLVIMFLLTGILAGPAVFGFIQSYDQIELLARMGISLLLFIVGLRLDLSLIRTMGPVVLMAGLGQIIFTAAVGLAIALALKMPLASAAYVAVALTFSSTIIIVKLLSDRKEIDALHGRIAVGILIVQDMAAILALVELATFGSELAPGQSILAKSLTMAVKGIGLLAAVGVLMRYVLPPLLSRLAQSQEMLTLFAIAWAVLCGTVSDWLGFSTEIGAFLAGVSLAPTQFRDSISTKLASLRDFLLLFFFIDLGARLDWSTVGAHLGAAALLSLFVLVGKPLIVMAIMGWMGYRCRTSFLTGLTMPQISEFSLIVGALGVTLGHIPPQTMGLITLVGVVTIFASTYMILYSQNLYQLLAKPLKFFERKNPYRETGNDTAVETTAADVILVGLGNYGSGLAERLLERKMKIIGVDFDPQVLAKWRARGVSVLYGDMADPDLYEQLPMDRVRWVVSAIRSKDVNLALLHLLRHRAGLTEKGRSGLYSSTKSLDSWPSRPRLGKEHPRGRGCHRQPGFEGGKSRQEIFPPQSRSDLPFSDPGHGPRVTGHDVKVALTAASPEEATLYRQAGAHVVLRPFIDAAEQGADALMDASDILPQNVDWPVAFQEIRVRSDSLFAGESLRHIPLRSEAGVSVLAVSRAGRIHYDPEPDFQVYPGDHVVLMGPAQALKKAENLINRTQDRQAQDGVKRFVMAQIEVFHDSKWSGKTLADLQFRQRCGVTVVGIRRGQQRITSPGPNESLSPGDHLIVIGTSDKIDGLEKPVEA
jgi:Kef-type K+ transport system membrane component KefB/Trk K+ transport system NAD-binding subunit